MGLSWPHKHVKARKALQFYHRPAMARPTYQLGLFLLTPSTGRPVRRSNVALAPGFLDWKQILTPSTGRPVRRFNVALAECILNWKKIWASRRAGQKELFYHCPAWPEPQTSKACSY